MRRIDGVFLASSVYEKGFGEIGVPVTVADMKVDPGDWLLGDGDGAVVLPRAIAVEYANRAMDALEKENRIREEIKEASTLAKVTELLGGRSRGASAKSSASRTPGFSVAG